MKKLVIIDIATIHYYPQFRMEAVSDFRLVAAEVVLSIRPFSPTEYSEHGDRENVVSLKRQ